MNKTILKSYLNGNKLKPELKTNCYKCNDMYLISDTSSIIVLNDSCGLNITEDKLNIAKVKENIERGYNYNFGNDRHVKNLYDMIKTPDEKFISFNQLYNSNNFGNYGINVPLFTKIQKIIKADAFTIMENLERYEKYIIRLENSKTKEYALLLCSVVL